jgi:hypothetical protein
VTDRAAAGVFSARIADIQCRAACTTGRPLRQNREVRRVTVTLTHDEVELFERAARVLAERARRDAENVKGTSVARVHRDEHERFLRFADRLSAARAELDPEPPPNVRPIKGRR